MKDKLRYTRAVGNVLPSVWIIDSTIVFKRFLSTYSYSQSNIIKFYDEWRRGTAVPQAATDVLPNYTELVSRADSVTILPIVRSNFFSRCTGDEDDVIVVFINNNIDYNNIVMMYILEVAKYYSSIAPRMQFYSINLSLNDLPEFDIGEDSRLPAIRIFTKRNAKSTPFDFHADVSNYIESVANIKSFIEKYRFWPKLVN